MRRQDIQSADGILNRAPGYGVFDKIDINAPSNGAIGYAAGCLWRDIGGTGANNSPQLYINIGSNGFGSNNTAVWVAII